MVGTPEHAGHVRAAAVPRHERRRDGAGVLDRAGQHPRGEAPAGELAPVDPARQHVGDVLVAGDDVQPDAGADDRGDQARRPTGPGARPGAISRSRNPASSMIAAKLSAPEDQPDRGQHARHAAPREQVVDLGVAARRHEPVGHRRRRSPRCRRAAHPGPGSSTNASTTSGWVNDARTPENRATPKMARNGGDLPQREHDQQEQRQQVERRDVERRAPARRGPRRCRSRPRPDRPEPDDQEDHERQHERRDDRPHHRPGCARWW